MKKTILVTFIFSLLFLLVACGSSKKNSDSTKSVVSTSEVSKSESSQNTKATESSKSNSEAVSTSKTNVETSISEENVSSEVKTSDVETSNEEKTSNDEASSESTIEESSSLETRYNITFNYALYDKTNALINSTTENGVYGTFTENTTVEENGELALSATLVEGYTFSGWYNGDTKLSSLASYTYKGITSDVEITARVKYKNYTLTITNSNVDAGSVSINDSAYQDTYIYIATYNSQITISTNGNQEVLKGFYVNDECVSTETSFTYTMPNSNVEMRIEWNIFAISYDLGGGTLVAENPISYMPTDEDIILNGTTLQGYVFDGWYEGDTKIETIDTSSCKNYSLVAKYIPATDTVYTVKSSFMNVYGSSNYVVDEELTYTTTGTTGQLTNVVAQPVTGFTAEEVTQQTINADGSTVVTLKYERNKYTVSFQLPSDNSMSINVLEKTLYYEEELTVTVAVADKYSFTGVYDSDDENATQLISGESLSFTINVPSQNTTYYLKSEQTAYSMTTYRYNDIESLATVSFDTQGGSEIASQGASNLYYPEVPTKDSCIFAGWYKDTTYKKKFSFNTLYTSDTTAYAKWITQSEWYRQYYIEASNTVMGYVNGKFTVCQSESSYTDTSGGFVAFVPQVTGTVKIFASGYVNNLFVNYFENGVFNYMKTVDDKDSINNGEYYLTEGQVYYIQVIGKATVSNVVTITGDYVDDIRDKLSSRYTKKVDDEWHLGSLGDITDSSGELISYKNELFDENFYFGCCATPYTYTIDTIKLGYDTLFLGWYDYETGELITTSSNFSVTMLSDIIVEARWTRIDYNVTSNLDSSLFTYTLSDGPFKIGDTITVSVNSVYGYNVTDITIGTTVASGDSNTLNIEYAIESDVVNIDVTLEAIEYSFTLLNELNVTLDQSYEAQYQYNTELTFTVTNNLGYTLKWLNNNNYYDYGDSITLTIIEDITLSIVESNVKIVDNQVSLGSYPQTAVTDDTLVTALSALVTTPAKSKSKALADGWVDYGYYNSSASSNNHYVMLYNDVTYNEEKYRCVYIYYGRQEFYDRQQTILQGDYTKQAYYWFKFEEILWDIYDISDDGMISLISDDVIDSQSFDWSNNDLEFEHNGGTSYGCDYAYSDIRLWLNNNFYNQVFTDVQKELITTTTFGVEGDYTTGTVEDYVGILDYNTLDSCELTSSLSGTAYSLIQGYNASIYWCTNPFQNYLVRNNTFSASRISDASIGVRPAITVLM